MVSRRTIMIGGTTLPFAGLLAACASPPEKVAVTNEIIAPRAPPAMLVETIPPAPYDMATWTPGYWRWNGADYVWMPGAYIDRPRREAYWVPARWEHRNNTWVYIEGHWG